MANVFSGSRALFEIGVDNAESSKVAYAFGVDVDEEVQHEEIQTLDALAVEEHVALAYRVTLGAEVFRSIKGLGAANGEVTAPGTNGVSRTTGQYGSLKAMGIFPKVGLEDRAALLKLPMVAKVVDGLTNKIVGKVSGVRASGKNFNVRARQVVGETVRFVAIRALDESELPA